MDFSKFTWFDRPATADSPRHKGGLSALGGALQGIAAPFAAAYQGGTGYDQLRMQQQQDQQDLEFQKYLAQKNIESQTLGIKKQEAGTNNAMLAFALQSRGIDPSSILGGGQNSPVPSNPQSSMLPVGQSTQPPPGAMMSMVGGGYGDAAGNQIQAPPQVPSQGQLPGNAMNPFGGMNFSFSGGKFGLKENPNQLNPDQANQLGQQLVDGTLAPSQLQGRGLSRTQALLAAKQIDPNYDASQADINYAAKKVGASGIEKLYNNVKTFHDTFTRNAKVALDISDNFDKTQSHLLQGAIPFLNKAELGAKIKFSNNPEANRLVSAIWTASSEYGRLVSAPGATGSVITDSARGEAQNLLNAYMTNGTLHGLLDPDTGQMMMDANNRLGALSDRRDEIQGKTTPSDSNSSPQFSKEEILAEIARRKNGK